MIDKYTIIFESLPIRFNRILMTFEEIWNGQQILRYSYKLAVLALGFIPTEADLDDIAKEADALYFMNPKDYSEAALIERAARSFLYERNNPSGTPRIGKVYNLEETLP